MLLTVLWSCKQTGTKKAASDSTASEAKKALTAAPAKVYRSLNGIEQGEARKMIDTFAKYQNEAKIQIPKSVWFRKEIVNEITKIFIANPQIDGVRIYFGAQLPKTASLKLSLILVATTKAGRDTSKPYQSTDKHADLYLDESLYNLYKLPSIEGVVCDGKGKGGARLNYPIPGGVGGIGCQALPHNISVDYAKKMVDHFESNHAINTTSEWFDRGLFQVIDSTDYTGVRVYLGRHPASPNPYYGNRDAFLFTTTQGKDTTDNFDCTITTKYVELYNERYPNNKHRVNIKFFSPPQDNGELCPNHCN